MRIILYTGKGGVGKTSISCATGLRLAEAGHKTLILSLDIAHSVADVFDIERELLNKHEGRPLELAANLYIQEIDVQKEIDRWWEDIHVYLSLLLNTTGLDGVVAEELAILPGMQEVSLLLYINQYHKEKAFDVLILDCAPTGESLRFVAVPTALEWYMKKIFTLERNVLRVVRPILRLVGTPVPLPDDGYFEAIERLASKLEGVEELLQDPEITSVRLVTLPEKIVIKETQRAFMYYCLYGLAIDAVIANRVIPDSCEDEFMTGWRQSQRRHLEEIRNLFAPVPIWRAELFRSEPIGRDGLRRLADALYAEIDPYAIHFHEPPVRFRKDDEVFELSLRLPWVTRDDLDITRVENELVINVGGLKKHLELPRSFAGADPIGASVNGQTVTIRFAKEEDGDGKQG